MRFSLGNHTVYIVEMPNGVQIVVDRSRRMESAGTIAQLVERHGFVLIALIGIVIGLCVFLPRLFRYYEGRLDAAQKESMDLLRKQATNCEETAKEQTRIYSASLNLIVEQGRQATEGIIEKLENITQEMHGMNSKLTRLENQFIAPRPRSREEK